MEFEYFPLFLLKLNMKREIKTTLDGSKTLFISDLNESYHSHHGVLQEAEHVFIENGLYLMNNCEINILEIGLGTGINAFCTFFNNFKKQEKHKIKYFALEKFPVLWEEIEKLDYFELYPNYNAENFFRKLHLSDWEIPVKISEYFNISKFKKDFFALKDLSLPPMDLVYFDAFGARVQPELWEKKLLEQVANSLKSGGLLTTYSSKGSVRRLLIELGFEVEKKQGPKGKREMMIAWKK